MIVTIVLLLFLSLSLFLNNRNDNNMGLMYYRLMFCVAVSFLLPSIVHKVAFDLNKYENLNYWLFLMYPCTIVFATGLQLMIYGKFNMDE